MEGRLHLQAIPGAWTTARWISKIPMKHLILQNLPWQILLDHEHFIFIKISNLNMEKSNFMWPAQVQVSYWNVQLRLYIRVQSKLLNFKEQNTILCGLICCGPCEYGLKFSKETEEVKKKINYTYANKSHAYETGWLNWKSSLISGPLGSSFKFTKRLN